LASPEQNLRGRPADPEKVIQQSESSAWYYAATSERVEADYIKGIITTDGRNGTFEALRRGTREDFRVVRRRRVEKEFLPARGAERKRAADLIRLALLAKAPPRSPCCVHMPVVAGAPLFGAPR
jgi:hypothetical protein